MIFPIFSTSCKCDCADRVIEYLENERYEVVPRKFDSEEQYDEVKELYKQACKEISSSWLNESHKVRLKDKIYRQLFTVKQEKKS